MRSVILYKAHGQCSREGMKKSLLYSLLYNKLWRICLCRRQEYSQFTMKKVTLVHKVPRYEHEKCLHPNLSEEDLQKMVKDQIAIDTLMICISLS